jgi:hypothetical protein
MKKKEETKFKLKQLRCCIECANVNCKHHKNPTIGDWLYNTYGNIKLNCFKKR